MQRACYWNGSPHVRFGAMCFPPCHHMQHTPPTPVPRCPPAPLCPPPLCVSPTHTHRHNVHQRLLDHLELRSKCV